MALRCLDADQSACCKNQKGVCTRSLSLLGFGHSSGSLIWIRAIPKDCAQSTVNTKTKRPHPMVQRRTLLIGTGAAVFVSAGAVWTELARMGSITDYTMAIASLRAPLPVAPTAHDLIRFATLAANNHNTQAWLFHVQGNTISITPDLTRATPVVDPDNHHLFISLGCAAENLCVAAKSRGMQGEVRVDPVTTAISFTYTRGAATDAALSDAIPLRQSTRGPYDGSPLTPPELTSLERAAHSPAVNLILITDRAQMNAVADLIGTANAAQIADPAFMTELKQWMRFNPREALVMGDGLFSAAGGNPTMPNWLGPMALDWFYTASTEKKKNAERIASSAGLAIFVGAKADPEHWVQTGRACQRFALQATAMGLKHAFLNQPVEVASMRPELAKLIGMPGRRPDLVMRFGRGAAIPFSNRRAVDAVLR